MARTLAGAAAGSSDRQVFNKSITHPGRAVTIRPWVVGQASGKKCAKLWVVRFGFLVSCFQTARRRRSEGDTALEWLVFEVIIRPLRGAMIKESVNVGEQVSPCCSFCKKSEAEVGRLVEGPSFEGGIPAFICADCVDLCSTILVHEQQREEPPSEETAASAANTAALREQIDDAVKNLSDQEFRIIELRYGLADGYSYSHDEVGKLLQITPEQVREIEAGAVAKLQTDRE